MNKKGAIMISIGCYSLLNLIGITKGRPLSENRVLNDETRKEFEGDFVKTKMGVTRYILEGEKDAPLILFVGGLTTEGTDFFEIPARKFRAHGYQTLRYDLVGRGASERSDEFTYDTATYSRQIDELLEALKVESPIYLIGQSLGGGIVTDWAGKNPHRVKAISLHCSAGYAPDSELVISFLKIPFIGSYVFWLFQDKFTLGRISAHYSKPNESKIYFLEKEIRRSASFYGYRNAVFKTIINFGATNLETLFLKLKQSNLPIQIIWGEDDHILSVNGAKMINDWLGNTAEVHLLPNVGHMPLIEGVEIATPHVLKFFKNLK
ncbi:alpha/beta hydrolase [Leptospira sp. 96542]|nr:alpha/beta hydrolase [Leptospira sp. 96542]